MTIPELLEELKKRDAIIARQAARIEELERLIEELKQRLIEKAESKEAKKPTGATKNYSVNAHERRQRKKRSRRKKSSGRKPKDQKRDCATLTFELYWYGADRKKCVLRREQLVWRLIDGRAQYVRYLIYDEPESTDLPPVDGVRNPKCEYGVEILITLAYLVYWIGISMDKACEIFEFFSGLKLSKSQADSLLNQLATDWETEYDAIAELIAVATILYIDETGWKVGKRSCYTWIFSTFSTVFYKCGVGRGKKVLTEILGEQLNGIGVTDNYNAYKDQFTEHQLCWAHFLRKIIAISLRNPDNRPYKRFLSELFLIYQEAVRASRDRRLSVGRSSKVESLQTRIKRICRRYGEVVAADDKSDDAKFVRLQHELVDNIDKLFVFVLHPEVEPTNNRSERQARSEATARKAARTSKSDHGARRRGIIMSVLASLSKRLKNFTLDNVLSEITRWARTGQSIFREELAGLARAYAPP